VEVKITKNPFRFMLKITWLHYVLVCSFSANCDIYLLCEKYFSG